MDKDGFRNRNERFSYLVACENARRIREDPRVLEFARAHLERFTRTDPHQGPSYELWSRLLDEDPDTIAERLVERSERGDYTRQTAPSFGALPAPLRARLSSLARRPLEKLEG